MKDPKKKHATAIVTTLRAHGFQAYFAGGCVRDMVMKKAVGDYDIATDARPRQIQRLFKKTVRVGATFGTVLVVMDGTPYEVTTFRGAARSGFSKNPRTDALNRDFTVGGLLYDPLRKKIIDHTGGIAGIKRKEIRSIGTPERCFSQDALRLLRAVRLSSRLGFGIERETLAVIKKMSGAIRTVSAERARGELVSILTGKDPYRGMQLLDETGLLKELLPEIEAEKGVEQPPRFHPEGDVFVHTMLLIKRLKNADLILALSCLLHDVGKPPTFEKKDRIRFNGHDVVGARMTEEIMRRLRFSNEEIRKVTYCVGNHMRVMNAKKMREATLARIFLKDTFETELKLHKYDCLASHNSLDIYRFLRRKYLAFMRRPIKPKPALNGHELMGMGFNQGPAIGRVQRELVDLQLEGKIKTKEEAKRWVDKQWTQQKRSGSSSAR